MEVNQNNSLVFLDLNLQDQNDAGLSLANNGLILFDTVEAEKLEEDDPSRLRKLLEEWDLLQVLPSLQGNYLCINSVRLLHINALA